MMPTNEIVDITEFIVELTTLATIVIGEAGRIVERGLG